MLGQLINKFDTIENATLKDFNTMFNMSLEGSENALVEIGDIVVGERREVTVDGNMELIELYPIKEVVEVKKPKRSGRPSRFIYTGKKDGETRIFVSEKEIARTVGREQCHVNRCLRANKLIEGWNITRTLKENK